MKQRGGTVFLTGGTGFIGSNLSCELVKRGYHVKLLVRGKKDGARERLRKSVRYLYDSPDDYSYFERNTEVINGDISRHNLGIRSDVLQRLRSEVDLVVHNAASTHFEESSGGELEKCNIVGTRNMLDFAMQLRERSIHYVSTAYVCGNTKGTFKEGDLETGQSFKNSYEESKYKAEKLIHEYRTEQGCTAAVYRPSIVVGDSVTGKTSNFRGVYSIIKAVYLFVELFSRDLKQGGKRAEHAGVEYRGNRLHIPLRIPAVPDKTLNVVPVDYVTGVVLQGLTQDRHSNKTYHIVSSSPRTVEWFNRKISKMFHISGLRLVKQEEFSTKPVTEWEHFFLETIKQVEPYLTVREPKFSELNTRELLSGSNIKCPQMSEALLETMAQYYISNIKFRT